MNWFSSVLEEVKRRYLVQWVHVGCGGAPLAYVEGNLNCSGCKTRWPVPDGEPLGKTMKRVTDFRSLVV